MALTKERLGEVSLNLSESPFKDVFAAINSLNSEDYATFQGGALEFSRYCYEQFESESSPKAVLRRLVAMLSSWIGVDRVSLVGLGSLGSLEPSEFELVDFPEVRAFSADLLPSLKQKITQCLGQRHHEKEGLFCFRFGHVDYWCAPFSCFENESSILVWTCQDVKRLTPGVLIHASLSNRDIMEFMIESAQHGMRWLKRLNSAQSLLYQDDVTGLFNFRYLDVTLDSEFRRLQRFHTPFSLLFIDLDNFKQVNDIYGHMTGSSILRQVGAQIKCVLRDVDVVIRYGGDEFVVVLIGTNAHQAMMAAERVRAQIDSFCFVTEAGSSEIHISGSIGVASCPEHARDKRSVLKLADETMYAAKRRGKNRVVCVGAIDVQPELKQKLDEER